MPPLPATTKQKELAAKMLQLGIHEEDLSEEFIRGSGSGGQKINKTSIAVQLIHRPTGIIIRCQEGRSQALNRYYARKRLVEKIEDATLKEASEHQQKIEKIRRQKRKRSKRAQEKMLDQKKKVSLKKQGRRGPKVDFE